MSYVPNTTDIYATPSTSATKFIKINQNDVSFGKENLKRKLVRSETKARKVGNRSNRKGDEMTLLRMHQENMVVLKDINANIARIADGQEAFLKRANFCSRCSTEMQNFKDIDS